MLCHQWTPKSDVVLNVNSILVPFVTDEKRSPSLFWNMVLYRCLLNFSNISLFVILVYWLISILLHTEAINFVWKKNSSKTVVHKWWNWHIRSIAILLVYYFRTKKKTFCPVTRHFIVNMSHIQCCIAMLSVQDKQRISDWWTKGTVTERNVLSNTGMSNVYFRKVHKQEALPSVVGTQSCFELFGIYNLHQVIVNETWTLESTKSVSIKSRPWKTIWKIPWLLLLHAIDNISGFFLS